MFKKGLFGIIATKTLFLFKPELRIVFRNIIICIIFISLTLYVHSEYINWSQISGNNQYIASSFILKNIIIIFSLILLFFSIKRSKNINDGFDKFRNKKLKSEVEKKLQPQENLTKSIIDDAYFDKFRKKKKLRTTQEIKLEKNEKT
tara:strand:+ start:571 stop:1011 length:441 start_codon:yes stop_codon:yes gene_type:complete